MFCGKCGTKLEDGSKFCGKCGAPQVTIEANDSLASPMPILESEEEHEWNFKCTTGAIYQFTEIKAKGLSLSVKQGNSILGIIPYGIDTKEINVGDIFSISEAKQVSLKGALLILAGIVGVAKDHFEMLLLTAIGIWLLFDKVMDIQYKNGGLCIKDSVKIGSDKKSFLEYVRRFNPKCIKIPIE